MRFYDILLKKRNGQELSTEEIQYAINGYVRDQIPDYQMSAFCMAVYFQGMTRRETIDLTISMARSGDTLDLSDIPGIKVDKHSTGGVGDKTTLVLCPLVAACGVPVAKMSGRGLGHTGGTLDKLSAIPGFTTELTIERFISQVKSIGISVAGQTGDLAPADKRLYALRDVTATVDSIPLIASSIMSKKLAAGADGFVLDVKVGRGAFMPTEDLARKLAQLMVDIGQGAGKTVVAYLTAMNQPLGYAVGNSLEVMEAIQTLKGEGPDDLVELCLTLGAEMLVIGGKTQAPEKARQMLEDALSSGRALRKLEELVRAQGGDPRAIHDVSLLPTAPVKTNVTSNVSGYIANLDALAIGTASMRLGAGRQRKEDAIDLGAGILLRKKMGDAVREGDILATLYSTKDPDPQVVEAVKAAFTVGPVPVRSEKLIIERIGL